MAGAPTLTDYVSLIITLFERFKQARGEEVGVKAGCPLHICARGIYHFLSAHAISSDSYIQGAKALVGEAS